MLAPLHRLLDRYRDLPADRLLGQPVMFVFFIGVILTNLVLFLLLSQPFAFENALLLALLSVSFTGMACSEPRLLALAYAFEQATKTRVAPESVP